MEDVIPSSESDKPENAQSGAEQDGGQAPPQTPQAPAESSPPPVPNGDSQSRKSDRDWLDYVKFGVEMIGLIFLIAYTIFAGLQWREMRKATVATLSAASAAQESADAAYAQVRPWIRIDSVNLREANGPIKTLMFHWPFTGKLIPPQLQVKVSVRNVGHTVAQDAEVWPELFTGVFDGNTWHDLVSKEEQRYCDSIADRREHTGASAIIFPSDVRDWDVVPGGGAKIPADNSAAALIVCVNYRGIPGSKFQSRAWYGLYEGRSVHIRIADVDASDLQLIRGLSGDYAY